MPAAEAVALPICCGDAGRLTTPAPTGPDRGDLDDHGVTGRPAGALRNELPDRHGPSLPALHHDSPIAAAARRPTY